MESWLTKCFATQARVKTTLLTFICISALLLLLEAWREDLWSTLRDSQLETSIVSSVEGSFIQDKTTGEDTSNTITIPTTTTIATPLPNLPALIAAAVKPQDVAWMNDFTETYEIYPYIVTDKKASPRLWVPANKGREAMVYLSYLINNYDKLPPYAIFIHGHRTAWHQAVDIEKMIRDLRVDALQKAGYVSLRCSWNPSCPAELRPIEHDAIVWGDGDHVQETEDAIAVAWSVLFPGIDLPHTISSPCCAQFAVTRQAMMRRSKEDYSRMRAWLLHTKLDDQVSGRVMEKLWAFMMTDESVHCPAPDTCACEYFGSCGPHHWDKPPAGLESFPTSSI